MAQVCALQWNRHEREILSSHGFSQNQLSLWKYPSMAKVSKTCHEQACACMSHEPESPSTRCKGLQLQQGTSAILYVL